MRNGYELDEEPSHDEAVVSRRDRSLLNFLSRRTGPVAQDEDDVSLDPPIQFPKNNEMWA